MNKVCSICKKEKQISEFGKRKRSFKDGTREVCLTYCKKCNSKRSLNAYHKKKEKLSVKYVYRFLDSSRSVLYIGSTENLQVRINDHFNGGHLAQSCYDKVDSIEFIAMTSKIMMKIRELYYINLYQPRYNTDFVYGYETVILNELTGDVWLEYKRNETELLSVENIITSGFVFMRKRGNRFCIYHEFKDAQGKKKQILKGSFLNEEKAKELLGILKNSSF